MEGLEKALIGFILVVSLMALGATQSNVQSHGFAEIFPEGDDLDFEGQAAEDVGEVDMSEGMVIESDTVRGGSNNIYLDTNFGSEWAFVDNRDGEEDLSIIEIDSEGDIDIPRGSLNVTGNIHGSGWDSLDIDQEDIEAEDLDLSERDGLHLQWDGDEEEFNVDLSDTDGDRFLTYDAGANSYEILTTDMGWDDLNISQDDVEADDIEIASLSPGEGIEGDTYTGDDPVTFNVSWGDAEELGSGGSITNDVIGDSQIINTDNFEFGSADVSEGTLTVGGGSTGDQGDAGLTVNQDGDLIFGGSLSFPGEVDVDGAQEIEGDVIPGTNDMFSLGDSENSWAEAYISQDIVGDDIVDRAQISSDSVGSSEIDSNAVSSTQLDENDVYSLNWSNINGIDQDDIEVSNINSADTDLDMAGNRIERLQDPEADDEAATKFYVDDELEDAMEETTQDLENVLDQGSTAGGNNIDMEGNAVENVGELEVDGEARVENEGSKIEMEEDGDVVITLG